MKVKGFLKDIKGVPNALKRRKNAFKNAPDTAIPESNINKVAAELHPGKIDLEVVSITPASKDSKTIRFKAVNNNLPWFMAGQFLALDMNINGVFTTRPYSLSSAPCKVIGDDPYVEITIKRPKSDVFTASYMLDEVKPGDVFKGVVGLGEFHYDAIRDSKNVVCLAGGSGITPFVSMAEEVYNNKLDINMTIIYGSVSEDNIMLKEKLESFVCDKVKVIHVLSGDNPSWKGEIGFIDRKIIEKYVSGDATYFICGPQVMYSFLKDELKEMNVPLRRIRFEVFGQHKSIESAEGFNKENSDKIFNMTVIRGINKIVIPAKGNESLAVAIERNGLKVDTACRSGTCGLCHIKLVTGEVFVNPIGDGRRRADKECGYVHACATYPCSDLTVKIPIK